MTPFAIAGIQMPLSAIAENLTAMGRRLDQLMARYPWVQMVLFSELAAFGPFPQFAQALPGPAEATFQALAARHGIWLVPGSLYEKKGGKDFQYRAGDRPARNSHRPISQDVSLPAL
jgi:predicted amidohydrolase